ncbi:GntR family transcriptional regulator [Uliginosibacterium sp. 31-16]|uniref:GntR family transcriptional regulator n=1 Tax=Uliginosibacterium sp. 31-16 TaxID=3068315 RepID=UPI00273F2B38|nr:GntR family transcriptional regulator [Uliginosibacterium sp. 31-16]MDP5239779.1 GntR family transcriptional regulator [Uliginosibacterium sp. 31-16]
METIPLRAASIGAQVHQQLRDAIVRTELKPGTALSEAEIAARYEISRQPVREAFIRLAQEYLVEIRPQRGTFVRRIVVSEVLDARFVREAIEVAVAREAASRADAAGIARLQSAVAAQGLARNNAEFLAADEAMHREIAVIAGREAAWRVVDQVKAQMDRMRYLSYQDVSPTDRLISQHRSIVEAIAAHDAERAEAAVREHMADILQQLPQLAQRYPEMFEGA